LGRERGDSDQCGRHQGQFGHRRLHRLKGARRGSLPSKCRRSRETFHHARSTAREPRGKREQILCAHHGQSQQPEYFHFLKYAPAKVSLFATRNSRRIVSGRRLMKRFLYAGLAIRLLVATLSPASGAPALDEDVRRGIVDPSVQSWKSGGETSTLPWSAPRGHHQPRLGDIPVAPASSQQDLGDEDARIDRIIRNVCRNC
jgi:hypothetical protein